MLQEMVTRETELNSHSLKQNSKLQQLCYPSVTKQTKLKNKERKNEKMKETVT